MRRISPGWNRISRKPDLFNSFHEFYDRDVVPSTELCEVFSRHLLGDVVVVQGSSPEAEVSKLREDLVVTGSADHQAAGMEEFQVASSDCGEEEDRKETGSGDEPCVPALNDRDVEKRFCWLTTWITQVTHDPGS